MIQAHKHIRCFGLTVAIVALFSLIVIGSSAFALPTAPSVSGSKSGGQTQTGNVVNGIYFPGPNLSSHSSSWGSSYEEHVDESWSGYGDDQDGNNHDDDNSAPVPEPTTALLMSLGLAGSAYLKRRKSKNSV